ncbi:MAG: DUF86 domain-containing protein [Nitrospirota bacterium]
MEIYTRKLELIEECLKRLAEIKKGNQSFQKYRSSWKDKDSAERNLQKIIEAIIDIGKMIIANLKLREPGNNREVFLILEENGLFPSEYMNLIDRMIGMRNIIVHSYDRIDDAIVYGVLKKSIGDIKKLTVILKKQLRQKSFDNFLKVVRNK